MKKLLLIGSACVLSTLLFSGCNTAEINRLKAADAQLNQRINALMGKEIGGDSDLSISNSVAIGGKNAVLLRNNLVYRPKLDFGKTKISGKGASIKEKIGVMTKTNLKAPVFNGLTKLEQAALCDAIDNACKQVGADMLVDPVWVFKKTADGKQINCEVVGRPVFVVGYETFSPVEVMQEYVDFINKNKLAKKETIVKRKDKDGTIIEETVFEKLAASEFLEFVVQGEMGNLGSKCLKWEELKPKTEDKNKQ